MTTRWALTMITLFASVSAVSATSSWRPHARTVSSDNTRFQLEVDPRQETINVFDLRERGVVQWQVSYAVSNDDCLVTDDGTRVITFFNGPRHLLKDDIALRFWSRKGEIKNHRLTDLVKKPELRADVGRSTFFSFTPWFSARLIKNGELWVVTRDGADLRFSLETGEQIPLDAPGGNGPEIRWRRTWHVYLACGITVFAVGIGGWLLLKSK